MVLNHNVWFKHLKFTLQTMSVLYPLHPNDVSKKKYYDFIQNLPIFFPNPPMGKDFIQMLDEFPVTPYLSSRLSYMKWTHFILNKFNVKFNLPEETFTEYLNKYYDEYKPQELKNRELYKTKKKYIQFVVSTAIIFICYYMYNK